MIFILRSSSRKLNSIADLLELSQVQKEKIIGGGIKGEVKNQVAIEQICTKVYKEK